MANYEKEMFVIQNKDGDLIGIDTDSGGYPWVPFNMNGVFLTPFSPGAQEYCDTCKTDGFKVVKVRIVVDDT
jgi:hypothetical protein